jgi:hypothetical protein
VLSRTIQKHSESRQDHPYFPFLPAETLYPARLKQLLDHERLAPLQHNFYQVLGSGFHIQKNVSFLSKDSVMPVLICLDVGLCRTLKCNPARRRIEHPTCSLLMYSSLKSLIALQHVTNIYIMTRQEQTPSPLPKFRYATWPDLLGHEPLQDFEMQFTPQKEQPRQRRLEQSRVLSFQEEVRPSMQPCFNRQQCEVHQGLFGRASYKISQLQTNSTYLTFFISPIMLSCKIADASSHDTWRKLIH